MGAVAPVWDTALCTLCGDCEVVCRPGAIHIEDGAMKYDPALCTLCGDCIRKCPAGGWREGRVGYILFVGGKMGRNPKLAHRINRLIEGEENLMNALERTLEFYRNHGKPGERFADTLSRTGLEQFERESLS
jgi:dissimilatory sulfite reductase (desulfoviridin) alpha/beta subunit